MYKKQKAAPSKRRGTKLYSDETFVNDRLASAARRIENQQIKYTKEELEMCGPEIKSRLDAEASLRKQGIHVMGKPSGELMLLAARVGIITIIKGLETSSATLDYVNDFEDSLLHYAAKGGQIKTVYYLLLRGVPPNVENRFGETPIFMAAEEGHLEVMNIFFHDKETNLNHIDIFGDNALHFACRNGQAEVCDFLIKKGSLLHHVKNQTGQTPLDYALENGQSSAAACLRLHNAPSGGRDRDEALYFLTKELMDKPIDHLDQTVLLKKPFSVIKRENDQRDAKLEEENKKKEKEKAFW